ncbi:heme peroxidase [Xylariaceae sp. FL0016]|nr:heme peroxidase [Xylariaceae sp. FL0016]
MVSAVTLSLLIASIATAERWPYNRVYSGPNLRPNKSDPVAPPDNHFIQWLRDIHARDESGQLEGIFKNDTIPDHVLTFNDLVDHIQLPDSSPDVAVGPARDPHQLAFSSRVEANRVFEHLNYPIDPRCTINKSWWWYRTYDGSCNWLKQDEWGAGAIGTGKQRDYNQHSYSDGISKPRDGPNARAVSNAFFKRKKALYYEHTPLLLGMIEFIMHDVTYSLDSTTEYVEVSMPEDEDTFYPNTTFKVWRSAPVPESGTSKENPRENVNMATTWLDISSLYGSTPDVAHALRSHVGGRLLVQEVQARGTKAKASYLPYNTMDVPTRTRPGVDPEALFAGGDPRTNEDWMMLGVHTLMLREHNRLCDILSKQKPSWDDEQIYQTIRLVMSAKYALMANSYQMAYWTDRMPWPRDDGFPLYRQMFNKGPLEIGPANTYPWPLVTKHGKPMTVSAEMAIVYRFHEFIISSFPIKDAANETLWEQDLFNTGFNATGFVDAGLENVLRGMVSSHIPNFKSGVDEKFRSAGKYRGQPFDVVTWSIVHEREQGLPTFNDYFREYNKQDPAVEVPIRDTWEKFSSDAEVVANLKKLYKSPNEVDLVVGVQLDEEYFPGTTVPKTALIISLFSLFGMGNSDRFSIGFSMMRCLLVDKPWDCHPSNALEELLWEPKNVSGFPDFRFYNTFWLTELDIQAHGTNLLWRLVTENSEIKCLQKSPLFPADPETNPVLCSLPKSPQDIPELALTGAQVSMSLLRQNYWKIIAAVSAGIAAFVVYKRWATSDIPRVLHGWPIIGEALEFQKNPFIVIQAGFSMYGKSVSRCFGIKLASYTHFVLTDKKDLDLMKDDNPYEVKFSLHKFLESINFSIITKKENFDSDLHTKLIRTHLGDPKTIAAFGPVVEEASKEFMQRNPLSTGAATRHANINDWINEYITFVVSRCVVGPEGFDNKDLIKTFLKFNDDAVSAMGLSSMLPKFMQSLAGFSIKNDFDTVHKTTLPIVASRRKMKGSRSATSPVFLDFILEAVDDDKRASDLIAIVVWGGLVNLQSTFVSTLLDIINDADGQSVILPTMSAASTENLDTFQSESASPWSSLRSAMFESIRLCGPCTGPARIINEDVHLLSQPSLRIPKGSVATLSAYATHRDPSFWGEDAAVYRRDRFACMAPPIGEPAFVSWGLKGPHTCPGRWFAQMLIQIMTKTTLEAYEFKPETRLSEEDKYVYTAGNVGRKAVAMTVTTR